MKYLASPFRGVGVVLPQKIKFSLDTESRKMWVLFLSIHVLAEVQVLLVQHVS